MPKEINATLQQQGKPGQVREYQIINGKELRIIQGIGAKQRVYLVHLLALADKSRVRFKITWGWFYLALVCLIGVLLYLSGRSVLGIQSTWIEYGVLGALGLGALVGMILVMMNFFRIRVFYSRHAFIPLFDMYVGKPNQRTYKAFLNNLKTYIVKTRTFWELRLDQQIAGEIRMLRRLASEDVIAQREYDRAKDKLFNISSKISRPKIS